MFNCHRRLGAGLALFAGVTITHVVAASARDVLIVAHRGASFDAPENTLAATRLAWEQGADVVEIDVHLTKDGQIVVAHDETTKRTAGHDAPIVEQTMAELRQLDAGQWKGPQFAGETFSALDEHIALTPAGKRLFVEIKVGPEIVPELVRCFERTGASEEEITIISFNYDTLQAVRAALPRYATQYLVGFKKADPSAPQPKPQPALDEIIAQAKAADLTGLDLQHTWPFTPADVQKIKDAGLELHVWTINEPALARRWIELGAASITTNRPAWLRAQLK